MAVIVPIRLFQGRGGVGAKREYERAFSDLDKTGRTVVRADWWRTVELDVEGFKYRGAAVSWLDIWKPLVIERVSKHHYPIVYYCRLKNENFGKPRFFSDTKNEFTERRGILPSFYGIGADRMLDLMNRLREQAHRRTSQGVDLWHNDEQVKPPQPLERGLR
jgi:hypothetical protein